MCTKYAAEHRRRERIQCNGWNGTAGWHRVRFRQDPDRGYKSDFRHLRKITRA